MADPNTTTPISVGSSPPEKGSPPARPTKLDRYRAALEAGTDPAVVQQWITQVHAEKAVAEAGLRQLTGRRAMTSEEINTVVEALSGIAAILRSADPMDKAGYLPAAGSQAHIRTRPPLDKSRGLAKWIMY